jgi:SAM-dependent methyltransferase
MQDEQINLQAQAHEFQQLIGDTAKTRKLVEGSFCFGANYINWRSSRQFIADLIDTDGTIIDIGCANGFLLRCLQEWSGKDLVPYGIDVSELHLLQARKLFAAQRQNFALASIEEIDSLEKHGLPVQYDFVYCTIVLYPETFKQALSLVRPGGKLIVGFYGRNEFPIGSPPQQAEKTLLMKRVLKLKQQGCNFAEIIENPFGSSHIIAWVRA